VLKVLVNLFFELMICRTSICIWIFVNMTENSSNF
jgi:hypothetical protein